MNTQKYLGFYWNICVLIRWTITSFILVILKDYYALQLQSLLLVSLVTQIAIINGKPLDGPYENEIALFNEAMVCFYIYLVITLTDFNYMQTMREKCSIALAIIVLLSASVNFLKFIVLLSGALHKKLRKKYMLWKIGQINKHNKDT